MEAAESLLSSIGSASYCVSIFSDYSEGLSLCYLATLDI